MVFDVVIGNPPYQKVTGGGNQDKGALPVYQKFVQQAKRLNPRHMSFLIPARWLTGDGRGLDAFRTETLSDRRVRCLRDFPFSRDVFPTVDVTGGCCGSLGNGTSLETATSRPSSAGKRFRAPPDRCFWTAWTPWSDAPRPCP